MYYVFGAYCFDTQRYELTHAGVPIPLRPKVFQVLAYLLAHHDRVVSKEELLTQLWPKQFIGDMGLNGYIFAVRKALGDRRSPYQFIRTIRGHGYRFVAEVTTEDQTPLDRTAIPAPSSASTPHLGAHIQGQQPYVPIIVDREAELAQLSCWFARVQSGERHLVFVTGEPGIGKTTLIEAWLSRLPGETSIWIACGQCVEQFGAREPYRPVLEALGRLCRGPSGKELVALLEAQAPTWLAQMPGLLPAGDLEALQRRIGGATRERMLRELAEVIDALTTQQTLVLVLEDLHWSDPSTLDLLAVLARHQDPARLLILGTYRSSEVRPRAYPLATVLHELQLHSHSVELSMTLLSEDAIAAYLTRRLRDLPRVDALARLVHQHTEGNPLFMVTLVEAWLNQGVLREYDGTWRLLVEVETLHDRVPDSLRQMIEGQLNRLSGEEQRVLEVASVAGIEFSAAAVAAGLGQAVEQVDDACATLALRGQWLRAIGEWSWPDGTVAGGYRFGHALYRHVLYRQISAARRVRLHQHIGAREEAGYGAEAGARAAELAVHFERGRDYPRAVQYLRQAGDNAFARSAYSEAMACYEYALETVLQLPESRATREQAIDLYLLLRNVLWTMGELGRLFSTLQEAEGLAEALGDQNRLGWVSVYLLAHFAQVCDTDRALVAGQRALAIATALGDMGLTVVAQHYLGGVYRSLGDYRRAVECFQTNMAYLHSAPVQECLGLPGLAAVFARSHLVVALAECGTFAEGWGPAVEGVEMAEAAQHPYSRVMAWWAVGFRALRQGDLPQAIRGLELALELVRGADLRLLVPMVAAPLGAAYTLAGRIADAVPLLEQAVTQAVARQYLWDQALRMIWLGEAYLRAGRLAEAGAQAQRAFEFSRAHQERGHGAYALHLLGKVTAQREPPPSDQAGDYHRQALALAEELGMRPLQAHCHHGMGTLYAITGQQEQTRTELSMAIELYRAMDMTFWLPHAEAALAQVEARQPWNRTERPHHVTHGSRRSHSCDTLAAERLGHHTAAKRPGV